MLKLHCFSYFLQFPDAPMCSAFMYSSGKFSSSDDDGLEQTTRKLKKERKKGNEDLREDNVNHVTDDAVVVEKRKF